jgi:ATP-dependent RNA helicase RhlE
VHPVDQARKRALLSSLIAGNGWRQVLVFTRTKHGADRLTRDLNADGIDATAIHGNKNQSARTRALADFKDGDVRVLVATDIAARGIDIDQLPHVVNFDIPNVPEDYVHRIGRTGRAGATGRATSLVSMDERAYMRNIERLIRKSIPSRVIEGFEPGRHAPHAPADVSRPRPQGRAQRARATPAAARGAARRAPGR